MHIQENVPLSGFSTMRLGGNASYLTLVTDKQMLQEAINWAVDKALPIRMIGGGSNTIWRDEGYTGLVMVNRIEGIEILNENESGSTTSVKIGAGENWDSVVGWAVDHKLSGIECLSLIPGSTGATPIQNVGAYGSEISDTFIELEAYDTETSEFVVLKNAECDFGYRSSRFNTTDKGRYLVTSITLELSHEKPKPPFYEVLQKYFDENDIEVIDLEVLRQAVITIRSGKLPDPAHVANCGSFFGNPIVSSEIYEKLKTNYPEIKAWPYGEQYKLSAGWLVEQAGFKGIHDQETGMGTWPKHALVLVNEHAGSTADLLAFKQKIVDKVQEMFGVTLIQEPELLP